MEHAGHVVTPQGVRTGESGALAALCERRGAAVLAYTREVCEPADAPLAAAEALARFRAAVWAAGDATVLDPERSLLSATRHAAAERARTAPETSTPRRMLGRGQTLTCARMPALIVARTENLLGSADLDRLSRHLERCQSCRATEAAFRRAERAYVATAHAPLDAGTTALFLAALAEAAPLEAQPPPLPDLLPVAAVEPAEAEAETAAPEPLDAAPQAAEDETVPTEPAPEPTAAEPEPHLAEPGLEADLLPAEPLEPAPVFPVTEALPTEQLPDELDDADEDGWAEDHRDPHMLEPGPATWNATEAPPRRRRARIVLPVVVLAAGAAAAMAVAGVFDGSGSSTATTRATTATPTHTTTVKHARHRRAHHKRTSTVTATP